MTVPGAGYRVDPVVDGEGTVRASDAFPDVSAEQWRPYAAHLDRAGSLGFAFGGYLVRGHGRSVLVDAGQGPGMLGNAATGRLLESLHGLGVTPDEVTDVLFTHLHRDHVGWVSAGGAIRFPNATLRCAAADRDHFVGARGEVAALLAPYADRLVTYEGAGTGLPGVDAIPAPGHTPGSTALVVPTEVGRVVLLGDVAHCPVQLAEPGWATNYDTDGELARHTRRRLLADLRAGPPVVVGGGHFPGLRLVPLPD